MKPFLYVHFYFAQARRAHGWAFVTLLACFLAALFSAAVWLAIRERAIEVSAERMRLVQRPATPVRTPQIRISEPELPVFVASQAVGTFTTTAQDVGLPIDEVTYALEGDNDQPYRRYRISMSVKTGYPEVRRFVAALATGMPNVALDAIRCARENAAAPALGCQLVFSAFYRRDRSG